MGEEIWWVFKASSAVQILPWHVFSMRGSSVFIEGEASPTLYPTLAQEGVMFGMLGKQKAHWCRMGGWIMIPMTAKVSFQSLKGIPALNICPLCVEWAWLPPWNEDLGSLFLLSWKFILRAYWYHSCDLIIAINRFPIQALSWSCACTESFSVVCLRGMSCVISFLLPWAFLWGLRLCLCTFLSLRVEMARSNNIFLRSNFQIQAFICL